jgi:hypothetical protein
MLHAAALAVLEDTSSKAYDEIEAFKFELLDAEGLDEISLTALMIEDNKVELIFAWIQGCMVQHSKDVLKDIPPPILSRAFQQIGQGMCAFHDACKVASVPFPFPYAQICDAILIIHWICVPFVVYPWVTLPHMAGLMAFIQVFVLWALNFIAVEIENPFGIDDNDLDVREMQKQLNSSLKLLVRPHASRSPTLSKAAVDFSQWEDMNRDHEKSYSAIWQDLNDKVTSKDKKAALSGEFLDTIQDVEGLSSDQSLSSGRSNGMLDMGSNQSAAGNMMSAMLSMHSAVIPVKSMKSTFTMSIAKKEEDGDRPSVNGVRPSRWSTVTHGGTGQSIQGTGKERASSEAAPETWTSERSGNSHGTSFAPNSDAGALRGSMGSDAGDDTSTSLGTFNRPLSAASPARPMSRPPPRMLAPIPSVGSNLTASSSDGAPRTRANGSEGLQEAPGGHCGHAASDVSRNASNDSSGRMTDDQSSSTQRKRNDATVHFVDKVDRLSSSVASTALVVEQRSSEQRTSGLSAYPVGEFDNADV